MTDETAAEAAGETALVERLQRLEQFFRSERREYVADTVKEARLEIERLTGERKAVVAWLRSGGEGALVGVISPFEGGFIARYIERGEHLK